MRVGIAAEQPAKGKKLGGERRRTAVLHLLQKGRRIREGRFRRLFYIHPAQRTEIVDPLLLPRPGLLQDFLEVRGPLERTTADAQREPVRRFDGERARQRMGDFLDPKLRLVQVVDRQMERAALPRPGLKVGLAPE